MTKQIRALLLVVLPFLTLGLGWQLGMRMEAKVLSDYQQNIGLQYLGGSGAAINDPEKDVDPTLLWSTWRILDKDFVDPAKLDKQGMLFGAAKGLAAALGDPYTLFMTPAENQAFKQSLSGDLQGIGAELAESGGNILVVSPLKGSPAEKAGIVAGDIILSVDGKATDGQTLPDIVQEIRGAQGTKVTLSVQTPGQQPRTVAMIRQSIHIPSAEWHVEKDPSGDIGYLAINEFGDDTVDEVKQGIAELQKTPLKGVIMDLRNDGGGYLDGAVSIVSMFVKQGKVVTVDRRDASPQDHFVTGGAAMPDTPMVVIVNGGSASASEITAGALQDNKRATILGVQSFGKGTVQEVIDLPGGSSVRVTIAHWLTPNGHDLGKVGITPDIVVKQPQDATGTGSDVQLQAALDFLRTGKRPPVVTGSGSAQ